MKWLSLLAILCTLYSSSCKADSLAKVRLAALKFGTVSWLLDVITHHNFDTQEGIALKVTSYAGTQATKVALQAGSTDVIVSDWLWVSRQRRSGADFTFKAYSTAVGALVIPAGSKITKLTDLAGTTIGVAGGPLDKGWLILNAYAANKEHIDLRQATEQVYGAPPLLANKAAQGELDAVLNYWHYAARLEAKGMKRLVDVQHAAKALGTKDKIPMIGFVFSGEWAKKNPRTIAAFFRTIERANALLRSSNAEWQRLRPLMRVADDATWRTLRDRFREGIPSADEQSSADDIAKLFGILAKIGGKKLVGAGTELAPGTVWNLTP